MDLIVGTAGHIDHGKTALVKALTGTDTDRLPEERSRGITIDLGFAEMTAGDTHFGFVDVPGHERFVRNMLAGASGIDVVLLVVAADEGVMPQTREHFDICRLLDIRTGVIALTKSDLVDDEALDLARLDVAELVDGSFLEDAPVVPVSSVHGTGIEEVRTALSDVAARVGSRTSDMVARLPIDRSFSVKGFGTVVTGTLASGTIDGNSRLEIMPSRTPVRIRGVQTHGRSTESAHAGQRVAVNLAGIDHETVTRGMTLVERGTLLPTQAIDAEVEVLKSAPRPLRSRQRVRVHMGTAEIFARLHVLNAEGDIAPGSRGLVQLRLESPAIAVAGERFILRSYSPQVTIAGGRIVDPLAERHRAKDLKGVTEYLNSLNAADDHVAVLSLMIARAGQAGSSEQAIQARTGITREATDAVGGSLPVEKIGGRYVDQDAFSSLKAAIVALLTRHHEKDPLAKGLGREAVAASFRGISEEIVAAALRSLESDGKVAVDADVVRLASHTSTLSPAESQFSERLLSAYEAAGLEVPRMHDAIIAAGDLPRATAEKLIRRLIDEHKLIKVTDEFYFSRTAIDATVESIRHSGEETIDVAGFKKLTGVSRKYAIPLLEYFDREHVTARVGDKRMILESRKFLTARWQDLIMANYEIDPLLLGTRVPPGTELDLEDGKCFVSLVGFMFLDTRVLGIPIPFHVNFEEVNLRFYIKRKVNGETRRAVCFIKEIVPRSAIAAVARIMYGEPYERWQMDNHRDDSRVEYGWSGKGVTNRIAVERGASLGTPAEDSHGGFIIEHYWGYTGRGNGVDEYKVEHPKWELFSADDAVVDVDFGVTYGAEFAFLAGVEPYSILLAKGSEVAVYKGKTINS